MKIKKKYWISLVLIILIAIFLIFYFSNYQRYEAPYQDKKIKPKDSKKNLENVNKFLIEKDKERIISFLERRNWKMKETDSGLFYSIVQQGSNIKIEYGDYVKMDYEVRLLDGTLIYTSDSTGQKVVHVGRDQSIKGLHEGLQYLHKGDKARFILPPHLGHGLIGDSKRIPARAILFYNIEIKKVSKEDIQS